MEEITTDTKYCIEWGCGNKDGFGGWGGYPFIVIKNGRCQFCRAKITRQKNKGQFK